MKENLSLLDFDLEADEMQAVEKLEVGHSLFNWFWTITGTLKTVADRLYAELECLGYGKFARESVLLMTADGSDYSQAVTWYRTYERNLGWKNRGEILGKGKTEAAYQLGASL